MIKEDLLNEGTVSRSKNKVRQCDLRCMWGLKENGVPGPETSAMAEAGLLLVVQR